MTDEEIFERVRKLLKDNMETGGGKNKPDFHFTRPAPDKYPFQFFWDTCFHVFIFCALQEHDMAKRHIKSLFALQQKDGFVGHMIFWDHLRPGRLTDFLQTKPKLSNLYKSHMSSLIQPPIVAQAVERIYNESGDKEFLIEILPKLKRYYNWLSENRALKGEKLLTIISPFESGMDWKPTFDKALGFEPKKANRKLFFKVIGVDLKNFLLNYNLKKIYKKEYFLVKEVGFNTIYAQNLQTMANLCEICQDADEKIYRLLSKQVIQDILKFTYNEEDAAFYDCYGKNNEQIKIKTPTIFYPLILDDIPKEIVNKVVKTHLLNSKEFQVPYPIPSLAKNEKAFDVEESIYIWRGPTWIVNNWFLFKFLKEKQYKEEADRLIKSIRELIQKSGFREYYNPLTGEGYGAKDFTWAGLIVDMIKTKRENDGQQSD